MPPPRPVPNFSKPPTSSPCQQCSEMGTVAEPRQRRVGVHARLGVAILGNPVGAIDPSGHHHYLSRGAPVHMTGGRGIIRATARFERLVFQSSPIAAAAKVQPQTASKLEDDIPRIRGACRSFVDAVSRSHPGESRTTCRCHALDSSLRAPSLPQRRSRFRPSPLLRPRPRRLLVHPPVKVRHRLQAPPQGRGVAPAPGARGAGGGRGPGDVGTRLLEETASRRAVPSRAAEEVLAAARVQDRTGAHRP